MAPGTGLVGAAPAALRSRPAARDGSGDRSGEDQSPAAARAELDRRLARLEEHATTSMRTLGRLEKMLSGISPAPHLAHEKSVAEGIGGRVR